MSPRPLRSRKISNIPPVSGFKPYGNKATDAPRESVFLHYEEYESLRLCDHCRLNHDDAAREMDVSRPTLTRIYARARQKIADALVTGKQIIIEGGKVHFDSDWHSCRACGCYFNHLDKTQPVKYCPLCGSMKISTCLGISESEMSKITTCKGLKKQHLKRHRNEGCHHKRG